jgi:hypothetical protein
MSRLDDYRSALLVAFPDVAREVLDSVLGQGGSQFASFIIDHGLGPMWHERTKREEFRESRLSAEALFLAQRHALEEIDRVLDGAGIQYAVIKGAASRVLLYANPAIRACYDLDLLVRPVDRVHTAAALIKAGFVAQPVARSISRELVLSKHVVDVDLHWGILREGRLRTDPTDDMISRRRRESGVWMLDANDAIFVHLVHPAFAKHLAGWDMGLHRVVDIVAWLNTQSFNWEIVHTQLAENGVRAAAWATLRWAELLSQQHSIPELEKLMSDLFPGRLRKAWLNSWLSNDLSARMSKRHLARLLGFSLFLHDLPGDAMRALEGRRRAYRRSDSDIAVFGELFDE